MSYYDVNDPAFSRNQTGTENKKELNEPEWLQDKIHLKTKVDLTFWCKVLNCDEIELKNAISKNGNSPVTVGQYLKLRRRNKN